MNRLFSYLPIVALVLSLTGCTAPTTVPTDQPAPPPAPTPQTRPSEAAKAPQTEPVSRWEPAIAAFEEDDAANPPPPGSILFIGSSSIRGWRTLADDFPGHSVINRGFGGSTIADSNEFVDRIVLPYRPSKVALYAGDNDINGGMSPEAAFDDFRTFVSLIHDELPETEILFISIKPSPARWQQQERFTIANRLVEEYAATDDRITYVDIVTPMLDEDGQPRPELYQGDKLHLTREGYAVWADALRPYLEE